MPDNTGKAFNTFYNNPAEDNGGISDVIDDGDGLYLVVESMNAFNFTSPDVAEDKRLNDMSELEKDICVGIINSINYYYNSVYMLNDIMFIHTIDHTMNEIVVLDITFNDSEAFIVDISSEGEDTYSINCHELSEHPLCYIIIESN